MVVAPLAGNSAAIDWRHVRGRYIKDPRLGHRLGRNYPGGEICNDHWNLRWLGSDQDGLIHNGSPHRDYGLGDSKFKRVFILGGSAVMGLGVEDNTQTTASVLEKILQESDPLFRVANCGVGAYMSWQQVVYLSLELICHKPDVIIVLDGQNDFASPTWGTKGLEGRWIPNTHRSLDDIVQMIHKGVDEQASGSGGKGLFDQLLGLFLKTRLLLQRSKNTQAKIYNKAWGHLDYTTWTLKSESIPCYITNVLNTIGIGRYNGAKVVYLFQPQLISGTRVPSSDEQEILARLSERMPRIAELGAEWILQLRPIFKQRCIPFHDEQNVWVEDASNWLDDIKQSVYHDWCHYNQRGQEVIAQRMADIVLSLHK